MAGAAEENVAAGDEFRVFLDEDFAGWAEIEIAGLVAEVFAMDAGPDEAAVGVDVNLGDTTFGGGKVFVYIDAHGTGDLAAGGVDPGDFVLRNRGRTMHDERVTGEARFDLFQNVEVEGLFALELESAVRGADGAGQGIAAGLFDEIFGFDGVGEAGVTFLNFDVLFDATEHTEFGFDRDAFGVRAINDAFGDRDVLVERIVRGVDHDGTEKTGIDAFVAGLLVAVIKMDGKNSFGKDFCSRADDRFEHALVGVFPGTLGNLDDERGLGINGALEEAHRLLGVVDVVGADGVLTVSVFKELCSSDDHGRVG